MSDPGARCWRRVPFRDLATRLVNGGTPPTDVDDYWKGDIPWITGADFTSKGIGEVRRYISNAAVRQTSTNVIEKGNLLIVTRTGVGKLAIAPFDVAVSQDITGVYPNSECVDPGFLFHRMHQGLDDLKKLNQGTSINGIIRSDLLNYAIDLPPLGVQHRIAEILTTVDEAIEHTEALIAKTRQIKTGLMHDLFTRGITPDGRLRPPRDQAPELYKQSPLGWIPREWEVDLLDSVARRKSGHTPSQQHAGYWGGSVKWLSLADSWRLDRIYVNETNKRITHSGLQNSSAVLLPADTVVLTRDGSRLGKSAVLGADMAVSQHFMAWICGNELDGMFLYWWLQNRKREFENVATGSTIPTIGLQFFKQYRIKRPSTILEQRKIARVLLDTHTRVTCLRIESAKLRNVKDGLMSDLLKNPALISRPIRIVSNR